MIKIFLLKALFTILLLTIYQDIKAQDKSIIVTYRKEAILNESRFVNQPTKFSKIIEFRKKQNKALTDVGFYLFCNTSESLFKVDDILDLETDRWKKMFIKLGGGGDLIYTNVKNKEQLWEKEAFGSDFLVENDITTYNWEITNETKKINKYICYKAISKRKVKDKEYTSVIAWFTPDLPYPFGPIEYCNLPGLILELEVASIRFYAIKIDLTPSNKEIIKPKKGKRVTFEELIEIGKEMRSKK